LSNCSSDLAYANQEQCFAIKEDACGVLKFPATTDRKFTVGPLDFSQERELIEDAQIRAAASQLPGIKARLLTGDFSFTTYMKPSGALGTIPEQDLFLACALGKSTPTPGVKVEYTLEDQLDSMSLWFKKGHTVFALRGAVIESLNFSIQGDQPGQMKFAGKFMERLWAGECPANDTCGVGKETIQLAATGALRYCVGMFVKIGTDQNTVTGYQITEVNYTANTIKISPTLVTDQGTNPTVYPFLPAPAAEVGEPAHGKLGIVTVGGQNMVVLTADLTLNNNVKFYDNEKNNVWTAERFGRPGKRSIEGTITAFFLKQGMSYFYRADYHITDALIIPVGNVSGKIIEVSIPYAEYKAPKITGNEEFIQDLSFKAVASASLNDELKVTAK
jgi:hypothetical protein